MQILIYELHHNFILCYEKNEYSLFPVFALDIWNARTWNKSNHLKNGVYSACPLFGQIAEIKGLCWRASHWKSRLFKSYFPRRFLWKVNQESIQKRRRENQQACSHLFSTIKFPGGPRFCKFMKYKEKMFIRATLLSSSFSSF